MMIGSNGVWQRKPARDLQISELILVPFTWISEHFIDDGPPPLKLKVASTIVDEWEKMDDGTLRVRLSLRDDAGSQIDLSLDPSQPVWARLPDKEADHA